MSFDPFAPIAGDKPAFDWLRGSIQLESPAVTAASMAAGLQNSLSLASKLAIQTPLLNDLLKPKVDLALGSLLIGPADYAKHIAACDAATAALSSPITDIFGKLRESTSILKLDQAFPKVFETSPAAAALSVANPKPFSWLNESAQKTVSSILGDLVKPGTLGSSGLGLMSVQNHLATSPVSEILGQSGLATSLVRSPAKLLEPLIQFIPQEIRLPGVVEASRLTKLTDELLSPTAINPLSLSTPFQTLKNDFQCATDTYSAFLHSLPVHNIEPTLFAIPSRSYFRSGDLFLELPTLSKLIKPLQRARESARSDLRTYAESRLAPFLDKLNPALRKMWDGAHAAAASNNPDKIRHAMISLRELFTQVIHTLAPDAAVEGWTSDTRHFHRDRPTREARLLYICAPVAEGPLADFVVPDVRSVLALADLFQQGTHGVNVEISPVQLRLIFRRLEGALCNLIDIRTASQ